MRKIIKNLFKKSDYDHGIALQLEGEVKFTLKIGNLDIGYLYIEDGFWKFTYSDQFKAQTKYRKLAGFSDLNKIYKSTELWPFFKIRIPGLKQPMIMEIIKKENLDKNDEAILLKRFGRQVVSNPYILEPSK